MASVILPAPPEVLPADFYVYVHRKASQRVDGRVATGPIVYVGKGIGWRAWNKHSRNPHWANICAKHGLDVEIVCDGLREWAALELEIQLIDRIGRAHLCNLTNGGDGVTGLTVTAAARERMSNGQRRAWQDETAKSNHKAACLLRWAKPGEREKHSIALQSVLSQPAVRQRMSAAQSLRMSDAAERERHAQTMRDALQLPLAVANFSAASVRKWADPNCRMRASHERSVCCVETGEIFRSGKIAMAWIQSLGIASPTMKPTHIYRSCSGKNGGAYGYHWQYA